MTSHDCPKLFPGGQGHRRKAGSRESGFPACHLVGMVAGADERAAGDVAKSERAGDPSQLVELVGRKIAHDRQVARRGLKVLAQGQEVAAEGPQVGQGLERSPRWSRPGRASARSW